LFLGEADTAAQVRSAWEQARTVGAAGRFLNATIEKALSLSEKIHNETPLSKLTNSIPSAALEVVEDIFGSLGGRRLLLLGTGKMSELAARQMIENGAGPLTVIDQSLGRARELAEILGGTAAPLADRWKAMLGADIVISATGCPHVVLTREEAERIAIERNRVALVILDIGMPRDVDPDVRRVDGILLYDLDGLERAIRHNSTERIDAAAGAHVIVMSEAQSFRSRLQAQSVGPTVGSLRHRLDEICRQELQSFIEERGPFTREQDQSLHAITNQVIQKIAGFLVRELKELPEKEEQEKLTAAVSRLFHLETPQTALAGTRLGREANERSKNHEVAINY
jgi:glutamyl-tRNA reductase